MLQLTFGGKLKQLGKYYEFNRLIVLLHKA